jgi:hypothetical protein
MPDGFIQGHRNQFDPPGIRAEMGGQMFVGNGAQVRGSGDRSQPVSGSHLRPPRMRLAVGFPDRIVGIENKASRVFSQAFHPGRAHKALLDDHEVMGSRFTPCVETGRGRQSQVNPRREQPRFELAKAVLGARDMGVAEG